ncbi:MAG: hypothetical protein IT336_01835, partial [Thermomicrobiales bacterium]|nr:hypothetical protein [Thermomicrobiales bacterium]
MSTFGRMLIVCSVLAAVGLPFLSPGAGRAAETPSLVEQRLIEIPDSRIISLSPDGTAIVATSFGIDEICVYERESLAQRFCTDLAPLESGLRLDDIVWSPDSAKIVLAEQALVRFTDGDLWVLDAATGELTNLTDDGVNARLPFGESGVEFAEVFVDVDPAWLPDSSGVTFSRSTWRDGAWRGNTIETVPVTGGPPTLLTTLTTD